MYYKPLWEITSSLEPGQGFDKTIKHDHRDIVDTVCQRLDQHIISTIMKKVTMCMHEQCVPNLAVPPWRPGYEANECVYMCTSSINTILLV